MPAPTTSDLVTLFPEFSSVVASHTAMVQGHLDAAAPEFSESRWGARYTMAVCLKAAHTLTLSPYGTNARIAPDSPDTIYSVRIDQMRKALPLRFLLTDA